MGADTTDKGWSFLAAWNESSYLNYGECRVVFRLPEHHPQHGRGVVSAGAYLREGGEVISIHFASLPVPRGDSSKQYSSFEDLLAALPLLAREWDLPLLEPYWLPISFRE